MGRKRDRKLSLHCEIGRLLLVCDIPWFFSHELPTHAVRELNNSFYSKVKAIFKKNQRLFKKKGRNWQSCFSLLTHIYTHTNANIEEMLVAQTVKNPPAMCETWVQPPGW